MIIKFDENFVNKANGMKINISKNNYSDTITIMTSNGPQKIKSGETKSQSRLLDIALMSEIDNAIELIPSWLKDSLSQNSYIIMTKQDYVSLPEEIIGYAEIIKQ